MDYKPTLLSVTLRINSESSLFTGYGMTELSPVVTLSHEHDWKHGSTGIIVPNTEVKVRSSNCTNYVQTRVCFVY